MCDKEQSELTKSLTGKQRTGQRRNDKGGSRRDYKWQWRRMNFLEDISFKEGFEWTDRELLEKWWETCKPKEMIPEGEQGMPRRTQMKKDLEIKSGMKISLGTDTGTWQMSSHSVGLSPSLIRDCHAIPAFPAACPGERGGLKCWEQWLQ